MIAHSLKKIREKIPEFFGGPKSSFTKRNFDAAELRTSPFRCVNLIWHGFSPQPSWVKGLLDPYMAGPKTFMKLMATLGSQNGVRPLWFFKMRLMKNSTAFFPAATGGFRPHVVSWRSRDMGCASSPARQETECPRSQVFFKIKPGWIRRKETMYTENKPELWWVDCFGTGIFLDDLTWFYYYALHHITCATVLVNSPTQFPERRLSFYSLTPTPKGDCLFSKYRMRSKSLWFLRSDPLKKVT